MLKRICYLLIIIMCAMLLFSCSYDKTELSSEQKFAASEMYRSSCACVRVKCKSSADSFGYAKFEVLNVLCGSCRDIIYVESEKCAEGDEYLVFLPDTDGERYVRKDISYLQIKNNEINLCGQAVNYSSVRNYITELNNVISVPYSVYYYETRSEMFAGCTDIIIGKPERKPETSERKVYSHTDTTSIDKSMKCTDISIRVVSSLIGDTVSGDTVHAVYMQETVSSMTDTATLNTVSLGVKDIGELIPENYYVFFLQKSEDTKQNYYFAINPIQGWVQLSADNITAADKNTLFEDCPRLKNLTAELRIASQQKESSHVGKTEVLD